jgi:hypothetical protein
VTPGDIGVALIHHAKTVYDVQPTRTRVMLAGISMLHGLVPSGTHTQLSDLAAGSNGWIEWNLM